MAETRPDRSAYKVPADWPRNRHGEPWMVGDEPLVPMRAPLVCAIDEVIAADDEVGRATAALRAARGRAHRARRSLVDQLPPEVDNAVVGNRVPDLFAYRKDPRP